jgi:hypothetical protein
MPKYTVQIWRDVPVDLVNGVGCPKDLVSEVIFVKRM